MPISNTPATGLSALVLALVFLVGGRLHPFQRLIRDRSWLLSLGAGVSIAYVFVHMMPEMATAREAYEKSATVPGGSIASVGFSSLPSLASTVQLCRQTRPPSSSTLKLTSYRPSPTKNKPRTDATTSGCVFGGISAESMK